MMMLFAEEDAPQLKAWIVKRLENTSDADADVLADYVLALLRHDGDIETVRKLCEEEIPDFLKEDSTIFVKDLFDAVQYRSFMPGAPPPPQHPVSTLPNANAPLGTPYNNFDMAGVPTGPNPNGSKKRSFNDRGDADAQMGPMDTTGRAMKQARRNGNMVPGGHYDSFGNYTAPQPNRRFDTPQGFPQMPNLPPGMPPTDPNDPMAAMMAMQAMGFPVQGMPGFDQHAAGPRGPGGRPGQGRRCRDYDTKGFCARGNSCKFEHGQDSIYVPQGVVDEYDPTNSSLVVGGEGTPTGMRPGGGHQFPGSERGRGRGRGQFGNRGERGGAPSRRGGRAEFSSDRPNFDRSKTTIVVENIPEEKFSEEAVRAFFSEFGEISDVTMQAYKRLALVKYNDWNVAQAAYNSPKVIFDNRFVKVYWYKDDASLPQPPRGNAGEAFTATSGDAASGVPARATAEVRIDVEEFTRKQAEVQKAHEEKMKKKTEMEAAVAAMQKRQEDLMKRQAEEKRKLMERLAAKEGTAQPSAESDGADGKPPSQAEALKKQLAALEAEAKSLGLDPAQAEENTWGGWGGRGRGRGLGAPGMRGAYAPRGARGGYRGRGGAGFTPGPNPYKLDNRPKKIGISGVDFTHAEKDESLRQYLLGVGEYADIETTPKNTSITFKDRFTAEKFMYGISNSEIPGVGKVELAWIQTPLPPVTLPSAAPIAKPYTATNDHENGDTDMGGNGEGDAMAQDMSRGPAQSQKREQQELDYDIGDDNEWAQ
ncbi:hypothetical protein VE02_02454 [Pseudogymnoascus sp. 03VT05]|nr:hypothetical protein VE02_02454 [Pseudogymnoascus sp. 03VT05]